ncbi:hypothetical protein XAUB_05460 [Xanthomonas citri pv. aurantifolii str. ICPB 11122]|nr:hypothetical protein XAUB_05460 [Xanthomonas citri pv. aurantifolii str. ICPB 11122]
MLPHVHAIEEFGGFLGIAKFGNTIKRHHRPRKLLLRSVHQQYRALGEVDLFVADDTFCQAGELVEIFHDDLPLPLTSNRQPYLPPKGSRQISRQEVGIISPQGSD